MRGRHRLTRAERAALVRRERAREHLDRIRGGRTAAVRGRRLGVPLAAGAVAVGALLGAPLTAAATRWLSRIELASIHVRGAARIPAAEVAAATGVPPGADLEAADTAAIEARLREHPWIAEAWVVRAPGGRLLVGVREREPRAWLELGDPAETYAVDVDGNPFARLASQELDGLPQLVTGFAASPGQANARLAAGVELGELLLRRGLEEPFQITVAGDDDAEGYGLRLPGLGAHVVLGREDLEQRLDVLDELLAAGFSDLEHTARIDLRFEDQAVLRHEPPRSGAAQAAPEAGGDPAPNARSSG